MKHAWTVDAARNNARWCNAVCFAHGKSGRFLEHMWVNAEAVPRFYPNAVTLSAADRDIDEQRQTVRILGREFCFVKGERIHTENSHKYSIDGFRALASSAGWRPGDAWTDQDRLFSLHLLRLV